MLLISIPDSRVQCGVRFVEWDSPTTTACPVHQRVGRCIFSCSNHLSWCRLTKWLGKSWYNSLSLSLSLSLCPISLFLAFLPCSSRVLCISLLLILNFHLLLPQTGYLSGSTPFDDVQLESAISGAIYEIIEREKTVSDAASDALMCYLKQVDNSHNRLATQKQNSNA